MNMHNPTSPLYIRPVQRRDVPDLLELATLLDTVNLPKNRAALSEMTARSEHSFQCLSEVEQPPVPARNNLLMLVAVLGDRLLGTASLLSHHGTPDDPHYYLRVVEQTVFSSQLNACRYRHLLKLERDEEPWTELGGLVVHPQARGQGVGKLLIAARLLLVAMHPTWFCERLLAELLPPRRADGSNAFWDALGGPLTGLNYYRADLLCRTNKEFIAAFFPRHDIVMQLLPAEAQAIVGQVGPATVPVQKLLQRAGFRYLNTVDPFDGGPHFGVQLTAVQPIQRAHSLVCFNGASPEPDHAILLGYPGSHCFRSLPARQSHHYLELDHTTMQGVDRDTDEPIWMMPLDW